jgi:HK97 gp10 family phage protein
MSTPPVTVEVQGIAAAVRSLERIEYAARRRVVTAAVRAASKEVIQEAKQNAPVRTGMLRKQLRASIKLDRRTGNVYATVRARASAAQKAKKNVAWYIGLVVGGTKPHSIKPKLKKSLAIGNQPVEQVEHPGAKANPFVEKAATDAFSRAVTAFERTFAERLDTETNQAYGAS